MPPTDLQSAHAALVHAAAVLNRGQATRDTSLLGRLTTKIRQPFEVLFGRRQNQINQALYDVIGELSAVVREQAAREREWQEAFHALRAISEPIHCRPGTHDAAIWADVGVHGEYRLPDTFLATDVILDVGAHIGGFSAACLFRGAGRVYSFEAESGNYLAARNNLNRFGSRAVLTKKAVWRSDGFSGPVYFSASDDPENTGGGGVTGSQGIPVETVAFDTVIDDALAQNGQSKIRLLKMDCEGSEYPILLTSRRLGAVEEICGEYHERIAMSDATRVGDHAKYDRQTVKECLERNGFTVELLPHPKNDAVGLFFAKRTRDSASQL